MKIAHGLFPQEQNLFFQKLVEVGMKALKRHPKLRATVENVFFNGLTIPQIARMENRTTSTVRLWLHKALCKMQDALRPLAGVRWSKFIEVLSVSEINRLYWEDNKTPEEKERLDAVIKARREEKEERDRLLTEERDKKIAAHNAEVKAVMDHARASGNLRLLYYMGERTPETEAAVRAK